MRKLKEVLRLRFELKLGYQQIGRSCAIGVGTVFLLIVAVCRVRAWRVRALGLLVFICLLLALGNSGVLYPVLRSLFPPLGFMRFPIKFIILTGI